MPVQKKPQDFASASFDRRHVDLLRERYGLSSLSDLLPILLEADSAVLLEVRSETSRKAILDSEGQRFLLKQVPWYADSDDWLTRRHRLCRAAGSTTPVPVLRQTVDGADYVRMDGAAFEVWELVYGRRYSGTTDDLASAGEVLAAIHRADVPANETPMEDYRDLVADHVDLAEGVAGDGQRVVVDQLARAAARAALSVRAEAWEQLGATVVHGDFNPWNLVFSSVEVASVVDWDNADVGPRLRDLVEGALTHGAIRFLEDSTNYVVPFRADVDNSRVAPFIRAYFAAAPPLSDAELACLPAVVELVHVELAALAVVRGELSDRSTDYVRDWPRSQGAPLVQLLMDAGRR